MNGTDLQNRLAHPASGETLLLSATEVEESFDAFRTPEERRDAAVALAMLYQCARTVCGPGESEVLFTRHGGVME
jgi:hypothetical protein